MTTGERIADVAAVPADSSLLFTVEDCNSGEQREAILVRTDDGVAAWFNYCQHWRDVNLDTGDGAVFRDGELVCKRHGATFECDSGRCTFGPCADAVLDELAISTDAGGVFLEDDGDLYDDSLPAGETPEEDGRVLKFIIAAVLLILVYAVVTIIIAAV